VTIARGRVLAAEETGAARRIGLPSAGGMPRGRVEPAAVVEAGIRAREIVVRAEQRAEALVAAAEREAAHVRLGAEAAGRAEGAAAVAALALRLRAEQAHSEEKELDRAIELARLLAERVLGAELCLDPARIGDLARQALSEARGARRIAIVAHPDDAALLERTLADLGLEPGARVIADASRERGSLRVETDLGVLDAEIAPQLDRLARRLRESLGR
jgi:flagellar assembly protein FliH